MHPFWFDLLYLNGGSLMDETQSRRFATLRDLAGESSVVPNMVAHDAAAAEFLQRSLANVGMKASWRSRLDVIYRGSPRTELAEDQAGEHARPGDPGCGMG